MRIARKLVLLALAAMAAMALSASTALATDPISVTDGDATLCGLVVAGDHEASGGCHFTAVSNGNIELEGHIFGVEAHEANCLNNFEQRVDSNGEGYVQHFFITEGDEDCGGDLVRQCNEDEAHGGGGGQWRFHGEEVDENVVEGNVEVCVVTASLGRCEGNVPVTITHVGEDYFASVTTDTGISCGAFSRAEFGGSYSLLDEGLSDVHINHL